MISFFWTSANSSGIGSYWNTSYMYCPMKLHTNFGRMCVCWWIRRQLYRRTFWVLDSPDWFGNCPFLSLSQFSGHHDPVSMRYLIIDNRSNQASPIGSNQGTPQGSRSRLGEKDDDPPPYNFRGALNGKVYIGLKIITQSESKMFQSWGKSQVYTFFYRKSLKQ